MTIFSRRFHIAGWRSTYPGLFEISGGLYS